VAAASPAAGGDCLPQIVESVAQRTRFHRSNEAEGETERCAITIPAPPSQAPEPRSAIEHAFDASRVPVQSVEQNELGCFEIMRDCLPATIKYLVLPLAQFNHLPNVTMPLIKPRQAF